MRTLLIPKDGVPFFGDDIPEDKVGQILTRLAEPQRVFSRADINMMPATIPVKLAHFDFKGTIVRREGQPILAIYEQI